MGRLSRILQRRWPLALKIVAIMLLVSLLACLWTQPRWLWMRIAPILCPDAVFFVQTEQPVVALTIDDGPDDLASDHNTSNPTTTAAILAVLAKYQAHATFFLIGSRITPTNRSIVADMVQQRHELGNHLWQDKPSIQLPIDQFETQLLQTQTAIQTVVPANIHWLRPGGGAGNAAMMAVAKKHGYQVALGSIWPYDTLIPSSAFATAQILSQVRSGSIVILHDHGDRGDWGKRTVQTLDRVLPTLQQRGFRIVTLSELQQQAANLSRKS